MLPTFFIIGAQKSATTTLANALGRHPEVFVPRIKELHFFSGDFVYSQFGLSSYEKFFHNAGDKKIIGEASTSYSYQNRFPKAAERIGKHVPEAKIIYVVRHPIERAVSAWRHLLINRSRGVSLSFARSLHTEPSLIEIGKYRNQLAPYLKHFDRSQVQVVFYEELIADPVRELTRCLYFIGADPRLLNIDRLDRMNRGTMTVYRPRKLYKPLFKLFAHSDLKTQGISLTHGIGLEPMSLKPDITPDAAHFLHEELLEETREFLNEYGKPQDFWTFPTDFKMPRGHSKMSLDQSLAK